MKVDYLNKTFTTTDADGVIQIFDLYSWDILTKTLLNGNKWEYTYNEKGWLTSTTYPNGNKYQYNYDEHGNKISTIHPNGTIWK
jgi:YD repeat-containing protein